MATLAFLENVLINRRAHLSAKAKKRTGAYPDNDITLSFVKVNFDGTTTALDTTDFTVAGSVPADVSAVPMIGSDRNYILKFIVTNNALENETLRITASSSNYTELDGAVWECSPRDPAVSGDVDADLGTIISTTNSIQSSLSVTSGNVNSIKAIVEDDSDISGG